MRIQILSALSCLVVIAAAEGDTAWIRLYRGPIHDYGQAIAVDQTGRVCATGKSVRASSSEDFITIIYDSIGNQLLLDFYTGPGAWYDQATAATFDAAGNFYSVGHSMTDSASPQDYDILRIKYPVTGSPQIAAAGAGGDTNEITNAAVADAAGNIYVAGEQWTGSGVSRCMLMKLDVSGTEVWTAVFGGAGSENDRYEGVGLDRSGNILVAGRCWRATEDAVMAKYTPAGVLQWMRFFDRGGDDAIEAVVVDDSGCLYGAGYTEAGRALDLLVVKLNPQGDTVWTRCYNTPDSFDTRAFAMAIDSAGSIYVAGWTRGTGTGNDLLTIKFDRDGSLRWAAHYRGPYDDRPFDIAVDRDCCCYVVGSTGISSSDKDCLIVKYDPLGNELWRATYGGSTDFDAYFDVAVGPSKDPCVVGYVWNDSTFMDLVTARYRSASGVLEWQGGFGERPVPATTILGRGGLRLAESPRSKPQVASLFDADGRRVASLVPGANDVSRLAPGIYFIRAAGYGASAGSCQKAIVVR